MNGKGEGARFLGQFESDRNTVGGVPADAGGDRTGFGMGEGDHFAQPRTSAGFNESTACGQTANPAGPPLRFCRKHAQAGARFTSYRCNRPHDRAIFSDGPQLIVGHTEQNVKGTKSLRCDKAGLAGRLDVVAVGNCLAAFVERAHAEANAAREVAEDGLG